MHVMERWERAGDNSALSNYDSASNAAAFLNFVFMGPASSPVIRMGILQWPSVQRG